MASLSLYVFCDLATIFFDASIMQVTEIKDVTRDDLNEISSTGTLKSGEKALADLRKRKLIIQK